MGNCLPVVFGHSSSSTQHTNSAPTSYTNPLALPNNSAYVNTLYDRSHRSSSAAETTDDDAKRARVSALLAQIPAIRLPPEGASSECAICMGDMEGGESVRYLPCMHVFHQQCVDDWLLRSFSCPTCTEPVDSTMLSSLTAHSSLRLADLACSPAHT